MSKIVEFIDLHCNEGGSDKAYHCAINEVEGGFTVPFAYGRVGTTLNTGCKTSAPVPLDKARKVYEKLVKEKVAKGYKQSPGISGDIFGVSLAGGSDSPALTVVARTASGHRPQLLNEIDESEAPYYINSPLWGMQEKQDGKRTAVLSTITNGIEGINKKGQLISLHPELANDVKRTGRTCLVDGEGITQLLHAFDLLELDSADLRHLAYIVRYNALLQFAADEDLECVQVVDLAVTTAEKQAMFKRVKLAGGEGVVFKRLDAAYSPDRPESGGDQLKCKFWQSATCLVVGWNEGKRSVQIAGTDMKGTMTVPIGNVTIPPNKAIPAVGSFVEIKYLYYFPSGSLFEPNYLVPRTDADRSDCDISKLKVVQRLMKAA